MDFIEAVRSEIKRQGLKQDWIAGQLGMKPQAFRSSLSRGQSPRPEKAVAIARALGVTVEYLVMGEDPTGLPADFVRDCLFLASQDALESVQLLASATAAKIRADEITKADQKRNA